MRIVVMEGDVVIADRVFEDEAVYVGSRPGCAIHLPDRRVRDQQLLIAQDESGAWTVEALAADAPVQMNGQALTQRQPLTDAAQITLYEYTLRIYLDSAGSIRTGVEDERLSPTDLAEIKKYPLPPGSFIKRSDDPLDKLQSTQVPRISRAALEVAKTRDIHELVDVALSQMLQAFRGRCAWMGIRRQSGADLEVLGGRYASGESCDAPELARNLLYRCLDRHQTILIRRAGEGIVGSAVAAPLVTSMGVLGMVYVDVRKTTRRLNTSDLDAFVLFASVVAHQLEAILREQIRQDARISNTELSVVRAVQEQLDPREIPHWRDLQVAAFTMAGQVNSGDVYDVLKVPGRDLAAMFVAHVHAEGAMLALLMAQVHSSFRLSVLHGDPPHVFLRYLNHLLYGERAARYAACFVLMADPASGVIHHCRAGRIGAVVIDARGQPRPFGAIEVPAVGVEKGFDYSCSEDRLGPGETIAIYTRGVTTATNAAGERFREKRFIETLCDSFGQPAASTLHDVRTELAAHTEKGTHPDDMTVLLLHRPPA